MKYEDLKIVQKWREYAGPKDERLEAENAKIYKIGFYLLEAAMYAWLVIVMFICAVLQTRKGYVDTNRFGQTEHLPVGYFLLVCCISGVTSTLVIAAMRCIAEVQIVPFEDVFWQRTWRRARLAG